MLEFGLEMWLYIGYLVEPINSWLVIKRFRVARSLVQYWHETGKKLMQNYTLLMKCSTSLIPAVKHNLSFRAKAFTECYFEGSYYIP